MKDLRNRRLFLHRSILINKIYELKLNFVFYHWEASKTGREIFSLHNSNWSNKLNDIVIKFNKKVIFNSVKNNKTNPKKNMA